MTYSDYVIPAASWSNLKKSASLKATLKRKEKKSNYAEEFTPPSDLFLSFFDTTNDSFKAGRKPERPYHESYIGTSLKLVSFVKSIHDHGRLCNGNIIIRRNTVQLSRLTLQITVCCSEKKKCTVWELGTYKWLSSGKVVVPNSNRTAFVPDVLYSLACYMTPTTKAHAEQFFSTILLTPPSRNMLNDLVGSFIKPYLLSEKERISTERCSELKDPVYPTSILIIISYRYRKWCMAKIRNTSIYGFK
jgi:hypothetical protein